MDDTQDNKAESFISRVIEVCLEPAHLRRTVTIALIVGTWITLLNLGGALWDGNWDLEFLLRMILNYLTPFVVSNLGLLSKEPEDSTGHES